MIVATVSALPTNGLITVYVYCRYPALSCIKIMQIIVFSNVKHFTKNYILVRVERNSIEAQRILQWCR